MHLFNIFVGLFKDLFIFAFEGYVFHAKKATLVAHFCDETLNVRIKLMEVVANSLVAKTFAVHHVFLLLL